MAVRRSTRLEAKEKEQMVELVHTPRSSRRRRRVITSAAASSSSETEAEPRERVGRVSRENVVEDEGGDSDLDKLVVTPNKTSQTRKTNNFLKV